MICPYCNKKPELVTGIKIYPHRPDLRKLEFWLCEPCWAYVGTHKRSGLPLGRLADKDLRSAKSAAHRAFDPIWQSKKMKRGDAYAWLARELGISSKDCHIGEFDQIQCGAVMKAVRSYHAQVEFSPEEL